MADVTHAMIQAAGYGRRLLPLTSNLPKPLVEVKGRPLLDLAIDTLVANGVTRVSINTHYLGRLIESHLTGRYGSPTYICEYKDALPAAAASAAEAREQNTPAPDNTGFNKKDRGRPPRSDTPHILISQEEALLDTGGGIKKATSLYSPEEPIFCLSSDWYWEDEENSPYFRHLADMWDPDRMDILQLLIPRKALGPTSWSGDYDITPDNRAVRAHGKNGAYMWTSVRVFHSRIFQDTPDGPFSFLDLLDRAESRGRLYALCIPESGAAPWHHISTYADWQAVSGISQKTRNKTADRQEKGTVASSGRAHTPEHAAGGASESPERRQGSSPHQHTDKNSNRGTGR